MNSLYETDYKKTDHFSFGRNWQEFLRSITPRRIEMAEDSLRQWLGTSLKGKTFVDIGCGSGLFSLAAYRLGAKEVVSVDVDEFSLKCAEALHKQAGSPSQWQIKPGSALDSKFMRSLGTFDVVYSWGVLHHTGDMYKALRNAISLVGDRGTLFIALYNDNPRILEGTSPFWLRVKTIYNGGGVLRKRVLELVYAGYYIAGLALNGINPIRYVTNYDSLRGMNFWIDIKDWLGGLPYEYATIDEINAFFAEAGFSPKKVNPARSIGCNEFLFVREKTVHAKS